VFSDEQLPALIEALIFASETPLRVEEIQQCIEALHHHQITRAQILAAVGTLQARYNDNPESAIEILNVAHGFLFYTKPAQQEIVSTLLKQRSRQRLSKAALETLAIIAYQQPVTKSQLEHLRGVSCEYALHKLLEKELIEIKGRSTEAGRPLLYGTSTKFMQHFGLASIKDLPRLKELSPSADTIGAAADDL